MLESKYTNSKRNALIILITVSSDRCLVLVIPLDSRLEQLVPLLPPLQSLNPLRMHLFCHFFIALFLDFRRSLVFDRLYTPLIAIFQHHVQGIWQAFSYTCLSSSFSSFISFSFAFVAVIALRPAVRFSYEVCPDVGRKADFWACHCLPITQSVSVHRAKPDTS